jgi:hypothetical protein
MEAQKETRGKITFPKILGAVVVIWLAIILIRPLFNHRVPMPMRGLGLGGDMPMMDDDEMMVGGVVSEQPMPVDKSMPGRAMVGNAIAPEMATMEKNGTDATSENKRIIKNGSLRLKVENTEKSVEKIKDITKQFNGEVANINIYRRGKNGLEGNLTVRVPVNKFEATYAKIKEVGDQILSQSIGSDDVTEQYVDLQAQIRNKKAEEETFRKLLERSGKLEDVLKVTREVARVRGEIDRLEGKIKFMESQTDMATVNVSLVEYEQIATSQNTWKPLRIVQKALHDLVIKSQSLINGLIYFVIVQLPLLIIVALGIFILYKIGIKVFNKFRK